MNEPPPARMSVVRMSVLSAGLEAHPWCVGVLLPAREARLG
ncbi:hypothetical protein [Actinophytocola xanthii]|nr:hypothetical protein [Actinophytocola xanthii]